VGIGRRSGKYVGRSKRKAAAITALGCYLERNYAQNKSFGLRFPTNDYQARRQDLALNARSSEKLSLRMGYDYLPNAVMESVSIADFERDLWSIQFSYSFNPDRVGAVRAVKKKYART